MPSGTLREQFYHTSTHIRKKSDRNLLRKNKKRYASGTLRDRIGGRISDMPPARCAIAFGYDWFFSDKIGALRRQL